MVNLREEQLRIDDRMVVDDAIKTAIDAVVHVVHVRQSSDIIYTRVLCLFQTFVQHTIVFCNT